MTRTIRRKIAIEYLALLEDFGERKRAMLATTRKWEITSRSVDNYVREHRSAR